MQELKDATILIIDDDDLFRESTRAFLEDWGMRVIRAENGFVGIEKFEQYKPDLVILDLRMPRMDGLKVLSMIRGIDATSPIIVVSGTGMMSDAIEALRLGARDFIIKPILAMDILLHSVLRGLEFKRLQEQNQNYQEHLESMVDKRTRQMEAANQKLSQAKAMLATAIEKSPAGFLMVDADGPRVSMLNEAAENILGVADTDLVGVDAMEIFNIIGVFHPDGSPVVPEKDPLSQALAEGKTTYNTVCMIRSPDQDERWVLRNTAPIFGADGEVVSGICIFLDITQSKKMENKMIQTEKLASLGLLVSAISHEISNPIHYISCNMPILRTYLETLVPLADETVGQKKQDDFLGMSYEEFREDLFTLNKNIAHGASRIHAIVTDLREFAHMEGVRKSDWIDLKTELLAMVRICEKQIRRHVKEFTVDIDEGLPRIYSNAKAIEQVVVNLLMNASQAADKEDSFVRLEVRLDASHGRHVLISVSDNGSGIDPKTIPRIFDPFFTTKPPKEGTGLGLYVSQSLVQGLGGTMDLKSEPGRGTVFLIRLPMEILEQAG